MQKKAAKAYIPFSAKKSTYTFFVCVLIKNVHNDQRTYKKQYIYI